MNTIKKTLMLSGQLKRHAEKTDIQVSREVIYKTIIVMKLL